jgi:hypothetical protein
VQRQAAVTHQAIGSNIDVGSIVPETGLVYFAAGKNGGGAASTYVWNEGTGSTTLLYGSGNFLRTDASYTYTRSASTISRAAKSVGANPETITTVGTQVRVFDVESNEIIYSYHDRVLLYRVPLTAPYQSYQLNPTEVSAGFVYDDLVVDSAYGYVMADTSSSDTIYRIPRSGGEATTFMANQPQARALAQDADYIYWSALYDCGPSCGKKMTVRKHK